MRCKIFIYLPKDQNKDEYPHSLIFTGGCRYKYPNFQVFYSLNSKMNSWHVRELPWLATICTNIDINSVIFFKSTYTWVAFIILYSGPQLWLYLQNLKQMQDAWILAKDSAWIGLGYGLFIMILKVFHFRGIWVVLLVKCWLLGSAQVMILNSWDWPPRWALLLAGNLLGTLSFSPPLSLPVSQINNLVKKKFSSLF